MVEKDKADKTGTADAVQIDVEHIAELAKIRLSPEEKRDIEKDLRSILEHIQRLSGISLDGVPPTFGPAKEVALRTGEDTPRPGLDREVALKMAPAVKDGNLLVPREGQGDVVEGER